MSQSDDLTKLFDRFGGRTDTYREIVREDAATEARDRWPLLASMRADQSLPTPPVQASSLTSGIPASPAAPADGGMASRFAAPAPYAAPPVATPVAPPATTSVATPIASPAAPREVQAAPATAAPLWQPATSLPPREAPAQPRPVAPASGNLQSVFARLEGRAEASAPAERTPVRRSFLDRLNRS